jgi:hypothetical protein
MDAKLEKILIDEFPTFFKDMYGDPKETCMAWGCDHGNGWFSIIYKACKKISKLDKDKKFKFEQIKEKFGGLNMYYSGGNEEIFKITDAAEKESYKTCEHCGTKRGVTTEGKGWILTLCKKCRTKPSV